MIRTGGSLPASESKRRSNLFAFASSQLRCVDTDPIPVIQPRDAASGLHCRYNGLRIPNSEGSSRTGQMKLLTLLFIAALLTAAEQRHRRRNRCNQNDCPPLTCADPAPPEPGRCCSSCANSTCLFRGCVYYGAFGPSWRPDPCTICFCDSGEERCSEIPCDTPECFGFPLMTRNYSCCPECDFGIGDDECGPIPVRKQGLYVALGDESCHSEVVIHECDKTFVYKNGQIMKCEPGRRRNMAHRLGGECPIRRVVYTDVRDCHLRVPSRHEIPQDDIFGPDLDECPFYFET